MQSSRRGTPEYQPGDDHVQPPWEALLDEPLRSQAQHAALYTASRMRDPEHVEWIAQQAREQIPDALPWDLSLPTASAELALFYSYVARCFPEQGWQTTAQRYLKLVAILSKQHAIASPALYGGTSGVAFVVQQLSGAGQRYQQPLAHLHQAIAEQVRQHSTWHLLPEGGVAESDFDLISGASGIVGYLTSVPTLDKAVQEAVHALLDYLLGLIEPGQAPGQEHWWCPSPRFVSEHDRQRYPSGRFNCGLAHGLPGTLAALALAALAGYGSPALQEALAFVSEWLIQHQIQDEWGITWPAVIPLEQASSPERWRALPPSRTAWCYGAPGIARSLWHAARALREDRYAAVALEALHAVLKSPRSRRRIDGPNLCHGVAGLLLICLHFAHESGDPLILEHIPRLVEQILTQFDPHSPLGFRDIGPGGILVDQASFLTGAPGVALALLAAANPVTPSWDRLLLLS
jgi:lantibiotic biosynthesis protein